MLSRRRPAGRRTGRAGRAVFRVAAVGGLLGVVAVPGGWVASDRLEQDNDFCNACHLERGPQGDVPLHIAIREDFDRDPPGTLAAVHGAARVASRPEAPAFRCIDCHGGTSWPGRMRVKALAAKDALVYLTGRFDEPQGMRWPLWDEDCRKCHARFEPPEQAWGTPPFHAVSVHNTKMPVACVDCHLVHERGGNADAWFLHAGPVRRQCARCHAEYED